MGDTLMVDDPRRIRGQHPGFKQRLVGLPPSVLVCLVLAVALLGAIWLWHASPAVQETGRSVAGKVETFGGNLFSMDCDEPRKRRRGGWVRALFC